MFRGMIDQQFPLAESTGAEEELPSLSVQEENALRYAAGYVCRNFRKKLTRTSHPLKQELVLGIMNLLDCQGDDDGDESSEAWLNSIDRGGLKLSWSFGQ
jgi:hypothetical protein